MHLHQIIFVLVSLGWVSDAQNCSAGQIIQAKKRLFKYFGLDKSDPVNPRTWPLIFNEANKTELPIYVDLYVTSITNVNEKAQSLSTQIRLLTAWQNVEMKWNPDQYCGIETFVAPKNMFWAPDLGIVESIKTDFGTKESPNVLLLNSGYILSSEVLALTTACKMDLYRFPFDTQNCYITFQSTSYSNQEITLDTISKIEEINDESKTTFQSQGEWELLQIDYEIFTISKWVTMDQLLYKIPIKRRPLLYVINIIIPVFLCLVLDVISFFIDTNGSDKLSFKVTLLLSISVMLLLVNDTLPSTADQIPLIGVYCCSIFCLMCISIVETIFVNYLMVKGAQKRSVETTATVSVQDGGLRVKQNHPDSVRDQNEEQTRILEVLNQILAATQQNQPARPPTLTRVARIVDKTFLVLYIFTIIVFLSVIGSMWFH